MTKALSSQLKTDQNGNVSLDQLKNFVIGSCADAIGKKDIEGFLSGFIYNAYGATDAKKIPSIIFGPDSYLDK